MHRQDTFQPDAFTCQLEPLGSRLLKDQYTVQPWVDLESRKRAGRVSVGEGRTLPTRESFEASNPVTIGKSGVFGHDGYLKKGHLRSFCDVKFPFH